MSGSSDSNSSIDGGPGPISAAQPVAKREFSGGTQTAPVAGIVLNAVPPTTSGSVVVQPTQQAQPQPHARRGRHRAVLVGINYFGTQAELRGCINDVHNMMRLLTTSFGWSESCISTLTDDDPARQPTKRNIEDALRWLVEGAAAGDSLFFHFSGHGAQQEDPNGYEEDGMNETICPVDFQKAGMISDDQIGDLIVKHLPEGVRLTAVMDCCHSGTGLDLPFQWSGRGWKEETNPYHSRGDVLLFSGCEDEDTSADTSCPSGVAGGAMTLAFCELVRQGGIGMPYTEIMTHLHSVMRKRGFSQRPQLTASQAFANDRPFLLEDCIPNSNDEIGRKFRKKFPPRPRAIGGGLGQMLGDCDMLVFGGTMALGAAMMAPGAVAMAADGVGSLVGGGMGMLGAGAGLAAKAGSGMLGSLF